MHKRLLHSLALLVAGLGITLLMLPGLGSAQDLGKNNAEIKKRIELWKTKHPELLKDVDFTEPATTQQVVPGGTAALFIGVNRYSVAGYGGEAPDTLNGCENDARTMLQIAKEAGLPVSEKDLLLNENATRKAVLDKIAEFSTKLKKGDLLLITFSGHGGEWPDKNGDEPADHPFDQTWCLHDRMIIDDELAELWTKFASGVRIVVFADSCNSGSSTSFQQAASPKPPATIKFTEANAKNRRMGDAALKAIQKNEALTKEYNDLGTRAAVPAAKPEDRGSVGVLLLAATKDGTNSREINGHGLFTDEVRKAWEARKTKPINSYTDLFNVVSRAVSNYTLVNKPLQQPMLFPSGPKAATDALEAEKPFQK